MVSRPRVLVIMDNANSSEALSLRAGIYAALVDSRAHIVTIADPVDTLPHDGLTENEQKQPILRMLHYAKEMLIRHIGVLQKICPLGWLLTGEHRVCEDGEFYMKLIDDASYIFVGPTLDRVPIVVWEDMNDVTRYTHAKQKAEHNTMRLHSGLLHNLVPSVTPINKRNSNESNVTATPRRYNSWLVNDAWW